MSVVISSIHEASPISGAPSGLLLRAGRLDDVRTPRLAGSIISRMRPTFGIAITSVCVLPPSRVMWVTAVFELRYGDVHRPERRGLHISWLVQDAADPKRLPLRLSAGCRGSLASF